MMSLSECGMEENVCVIYFSAEEIELYKTHTRIHVLGELIKRIRQHDKDNYVFCIHELPDESYIDIYTEVFEEDVCNLSQLDVSIILSCIKRVMINWEHYFREGNIGYIQSRLKSHISKSVNYMLSLKDQSLKFMENNNPDRMAIKIKCPVRKFKTMLYQIIPPDNDIINNKTNLSRDMKKLTAFISSKDIINWPHIAVSVSFPKFHLVHCNMPQSKYELIKFDADYKPNVKSRCTDLKYKTLTEDRRTLNFKVVSEYIDHLKQYIRVNTNIRIGKKVDLLSILTEFKQDVELCTETIDTDTEYYAPTGKYPYVRYLGQPHGGELDQPSITIAEQIKTVCDETNIRLQETINPITKFVLKKFDVQFEMKKSKYTFAAEEESILALRNCLTYECLLCNKVFSSFTTEEVGRHLIHEHGPEPDWLCVRCGGNYNTRKLSCEKWSHHCASKKSKKKKSK